MNKLLHELDEEIGHLTHQIHNTKIGGGQLTTQERDMHTELLKLNKLAVDLNNQNYHLMKRKNDRDQRIHEDRLAIEKEIGGV